MQKKPEVSKNPWSYVGSTIGIVVVVFLFWGSKCEPIAIPPQQDSVNYYSTPYIPDTVLFCGELVPLDYFDVIESLERELLVNSYWHSQTILLLQKTTRYFPVIEPILARYNIPDDFKYLAVAESGLAHKVSPAGATGFWQLLEGTAKDYGLEINSEVDERYHIEKATEVACKYISESYEKYGNWTVTAASYNIGRRGMDRQITKQKESDYYNLLLNSETGRYVYRIIALKLVLENPELYDFSIPENRFFRPIESKQVEVDTSVANWTDFAQENGTNYKMLKTLNPWLRDNTLTNKANKTYLVKIPKKKARILNN